MVAEFGAAQTALYGSSKAALVLLTTSWAAEYVPAGVRVNAVSPGPTRTEGTVSMGNALDQLASGAPAGRPGEPEEIAAAATFLAAESASWIQARSFPSTADESPSETEQQSPATDAKTMSPRPPNPALADKPGADPRRAGPPRS